MTVEAQKNGFGVTGKQGKTEQRYTRGTGLRGKVGAAIVISIKS